MSKFFNDTRIAGGASRSPEISAIDIEAAVGSLKETIHTHSYANGHANEKEVSRLLVPIDKTDNLSSDVAATRLANCRAIRLPRTEEKSFLITEYNLAMQAAAEAYRTLRTRLSKQQTKSGMRSIVISSAAQGEGKTLTSFNLALCYSKMQNFPLLLVDADLRRQGLSRLLGDPDSPGLARILEDSCDYSSAILRSDMPGLYVLPAGSASSSPAELFSTPNWKEFMGWASETFRLVIVDCPPVLDVADFELVMAPCDSALLVVRSRKTDSTSLSKVLAQMDTKRLAGVVFNAAEDPSRGYYYAAANPV